MLRGARFETNHNLPVRIAASCGHLEVVRYLAGIGADICDFGNGALIIAAQNGHLETVIYLIKRGAVVHTDNYCASRLAFESGHQSVFTYLLSVNQKNLHMDNNLTSFLKINNFLVENSIEIESIIYQLLWLTMYGDVTTIDVTLTSNGSIRTDITQDMLNIIAKWAYLNCQEKVVNLLVRYGAVLP